LQDPRRSFNLNKVVSALQDSAPEQRGYSSSQASAAVTNPGTAGTHATRTPDGESHSSGGSGSGAASRPGTGAGGSRPMTGGPRLRTPNPSDPALRAAVPDGSILKTEESMVMQIEEEHENEEEDWEALIASVFGDEDNFEKSRETLGGSGLSGGHLPGVVDDESDGDLQVKFCVIYLHFIYAYDEDRSRRTLLVHA